MHPLMNIAISAARKAGEFVFRAGQRLDLVHAVEKEKHDFVTQVDHESEQIIINTIRQAYPNHGILAEESGESTGIDEYRWVIDPIDGTRNFMNGYPHYAISIGIEIKNKLEIAVIYEPHTNELFTAQKGKGAQLNNQRLRVGGRSQLDEALLATGFPIKAPQYAQLQFKIMQEIINHTGDIRRTGSAALDLAYVAAGRLDGFWEFKLQPWDIAAGILLVKEAGGLIGDFHGEENFYEIGNIIAANPKIFKALLQIIKPALPVST